MKCVRQLWNIDTKVFREMEKLVRFDLRTIVNSEVSPSTWIVKNAIRTQLRLDNPSRP